MMKSKGSFILVAIAFALVNSHVAAADPATHVYECKVDGQRVFSDHECGDDATERDVVVTNRMDATKPSPEGSKSSKPQRTQHKRSSADVDDKDKRRQQCARIQSSRDALNDKMRAGYTGKQDERLHQRLRKLDDDYFRLRCSSVR